MIRRSARIQAGGRRADTEGMRRMPTPSILRPRGRVAGLRLGLVAVLCLVPVAGVPESRLSAAAPVSGGRGLSVSAGLRIEVHVTRVMSLNASPTGSAVWSNAGTVVSGCVGAGACVSRASGASGLNQAHFPAAGLTFAQP